MIRLAFSSLAALCVIACAAGGDPDAGEREDGAAPLQLLASTQPAAQEGETVTGTNGLRFTLPPGVTRASLGEREVEKLAVQVMLDRARYSPGVIDGLGGSNTERAIRAFRHESGLDEGGSLDREVLEALLDEHGGSFFAGYTITPQDLSGPFVNVPDELAAQAELDRLGYASPLEMLAERFHMDEDLLATLNPRADFTRAGTTIAVIARRTGPLPAQIARIEVRREAGAVVTLADDGSVIASYPATIGSAQFPSPSGTMEVTEIAPDANYTFLAEGRDWGPERNLVIAPGPNNPVGGIWIGLSQEGYGIHGSPDPHLIGKTASHGCVRLTNWDARELAEAVESGIVVTFV